jgi:hypothetical protein
MNINLNIPYFYALSLIMHKRRIAAKVVQMYYNCGIVIKGRLREI